MHKYTRSVGFSNFKSQRRIANLFRSVINMPSRKIITSVNVDMSLIQFEKDYNDTDKDRIGISLVGEYEPDGDISIEHYFPYIKGDYSMEFDSISVERQTDKESYAGICEDNRLDMTLIFYIINIADYAKSTYYNYSNRNITKVKFSALSIDGTILLGFKKTTDQILYEKRTDNKRKELLAAARMGDNEAVENLATSEMDTYSMIGNRIKHEDMLTIIDTSFMPCGVECDHYMIIANILEVHKVMNFHTKENLYSMTVEANNIVMNLCINEQDLVGEPLPGRRFHGEIWLQGIIFI